MTQNDFDVSLKIRPWTPKTGQVPHLTIETNMTCNFRCVSCYNIDRNFVKSLETVKQEIDLGLQIRKADTVTLLGGEPTLHPDLTEIIRYLADRINPLPGRKIPEHFPPDIAETVFSHLS